MEENIFSRTPFKIVKWDLHSNTWRKTVYIAGGSMNPAELKHAHKALKKGAGPRPDAPSPPPPKVSVETTGATVTGDQKVDASVPTSKTGGGTGGPDSPQGGESTTPDNKVGNRDTGGTDLEPDVRIDDASLLPVDLPGDSSGMQINMSEFSISQDDVQAITHEEKMTDVKSTGSVMKEFAVYPEDKISDLKHKINKYLGIPIFRQHLWFVYQNRSFPMKYQFLVGGSGISVDMYSLISSWGGTSGTSGDVLGIPVDMELYKNKDSIKVEAYDPFTILSNIYNQYGISEYHVVDLETFIGPRRRGLADLSKSDKYQISILYFSFVLKYFPMIDQAVWDEYIDSKSVRNSYSQLDPSPGDLLYIDRQRDLMNGMYDLLENDRKRTTRISLLLQKSLTSTTIKISSPYRGKIVNFRILFDKLHVNETLDAICIVESHGGHNVQFEKTYKKNDPVSDKMMPGTFYMRIIVSEDPYQKLGVFLFPNGSYSISGSWGESMNYGFGDVNNIIDTHVTPIIREINEIDGSVMYVSGMKLPIADRTNIKYVDISISMFWKQALNSDGFRAFREILDKFVSAHIIQEKLLEHSVLTYYFKKGIYELDARRIEKLHSVDNYYAYLYNSDVRQKWFMLFENIRIITVSHRFSDIKIDMTGIKEDEYNIFQRFIVYMISLAETMTIRKTGAPERKIKSLSSLKEHDPVLYSFKKADSTGEVYSKICQRPYQPLLMTPEQYSALPKSIRESSVQYWNMTTGTPAYYRCPNPKYPYIRFITGKHPKGYCIPCCKITPPSTAPAQKRVYDECVKEGKYEKIRVDTSNSRYIMSYGKSIDIGRLSNLPETSLEPLFSDSNVESNTSSHNHGSVLEAKYYLCGIQQHLGAMERVGMVFCLAHALGMDVVQLAVETCKRINATRAYFPLILNGRCARAYQSPRELCTVIMHTFGGTGGATCLFTGGSGDAGLGDAGLGEGPVETDGGEVDETFETDADATSRDTVPGWNDFFIDIARIYFNIHVVVFEDVKTVVQLNIPPIITVDDYTYPDHQHLLVLKNHQSGNWNPIYVIHKDIYFRTGMIEKKMFDFQSDIIQIIIKMVDSKLRSRRTAYDMTLNVVRRMLASKKMKISSIFLSRDNHVYGVVVQGLGYIPVASSYYKFDAGVPVQFGVSEKDFADAKQLLRFTAAWNQWVGHESEHAGYAIVDVPADRPLLERVEPMYPLVYPERWTILPGGKVRGFTACGMNWYTASISEQSAKAIYDAPVLRLNYDPIKINAIVESKAEGASDPRTQGIHQAFYNHYLYRLIVLEYIRFFNRHRNTRIRGEILKLFARGDFRTRLSDIYAKLTNLVIGDGDPNPLLVADVEKIKSQISDFMVTGNKKQLLATFQGDYYNFDRDILEKMKKAPRDQVRAQLHKLSEAFITVGTPKITDFSNILSSCGNGHDNDGGRCKGSKLVVPRDKLDKYLDILSDQIKNPFMEKYIFSPVFADYVVNYFKFERQDDAVVRVSF